RLNCCGAIERRKISRSAASDRSSNRAFFALLAALFTASAVVTVICCLSMSAMGEMSMPGGWVMSMVWLRRRGGTWFDAGASFVALWGVMMVAMMLPSLVPTLWRYHQHFCNTDDTRSGWLTVLVGVGYFLAWIGFGIVAFPLGAALAAVEMQQPV